MKGQASMLLALIIAIAIFIGWVYMKYLTVETFSRSVANTYDIQLALYKKRIVKSYVKTAARLSYQMALSDVSRDEDFLYTPFIINNKMKIPDEEYFEGKLGEHTLEYTNSFIEGLEKELDIEMEGFKCFDIDRHGNNVRISLTGGRLRIHGGIEIDEPLNISFEDETSLFELYKRNREIVGEFFRHLKTACDFSVGGCYPTEVYNEISNLAAQIEKIAEAKSSGDIICRVNIEKAYVEPYAADTSCKTSGSCRLLPRSASFVEAGGSCSKMPFSFYENSESGYFNHKSEDFQNCFEYRRAIIEYLISVVCRKKGEFVFDDARKSYRELEFGSVIWSKADSNYGCVNKGVISPSTELVSVVEGKCQCKNTCTICGTARDFARECECNKNIHDDEGILVAGPDFPGNSENIKRFVSKYMGHPECMASWTARCKNLANSIKPLCDTTCSPAVPVVIRG